MGIVVGLGNPGPRYEYTRHNVGFAVVELLARRWGVRLEPTHSGTHCAHARFAGKEVLLVEPQWLMNRSGEALVAAGLQVTTDSIVTHDDLDLECGRVRVKFGGGAGGHRGVESIENHFGNQFVRVRLGIGRPPAEMDTAAYVLSRFSPDEAAFAEAAARRAADAIECVLREGQEAAMNAFNARNQVAPV
jgi:PTH1 family peptidyl-tRNA hydrolase